MPPDILDLVKTWLANHELYGHLYVDIQSTHASTSGGRVLLVKIENDSTWDGRKLGQSWLKNYLFSLSKKGKVWRWDGDADRMAISEMLYPSDPDFFQKLEAVIRRAMVLRVL